MVHLRGGVRVSFSQFYVIGEPGGEQPMFEDSFYGQVNALCGAQTRTGLFLVTGLYMGMVPVDVDFFDSVPPLGDEWEEAVDASIELVAPQLTVLGWGGESVHQVRVPRTGSYRVRYCATGMDAGRQSNALASVREAPDRYLLQFWPGPLGTDQILRQTSATARTAHAAVGQILPP